jgi:serine/threonine protein kinase
LNPERWAQIEDLFHRAAESDPQHRTAVLDQACGDDSELREQVEALLSSDHSARSKMQAAVRSEFESVAFSLIGKTVSHYRILGAVGGGGMGLVYRAEDVKLGRRVAIKFLPDESAKDPAALQRFEREARSASALEHPNICPIYEFGEHEGQPFLVMQLLDGQTLRELIPSVEPGKPPFSIHKLIDIAIQISAGLHAAHSQGIIHRDIKPANIFVTTQGEVKILDFGLAKLARTITEPTEGEEGTRTLPADLFLSRPGIAMGTAAYMSPEQIRGEKLDARTDIFSFGLVLYEMAVGQRAFPEKTGPAVQDAILNQTPTPVRELNPAVSAKLEQVINKTLEKDRDARYQTASGMEAELEALQHQLAPKRLPRRWAMGLGIAAVIFIAIFIGMLMKKPKTVSVAPEIKLRQLTTNSSENPVTGGAISPDGKYLAYIDTRGLHLKFIDTGETRTIPKSEVVKDQSMQWEMGPWFPDGTRLLINVRPSTAEQWNDSNISIWAVSVPGAVATKFRDHAFAWSVSPDCSLVSFGRGKGKLGPREFWLMGPDGEQARKFQETDEGSAIVSFGWSPNGKRYGYILTNASGDTLLSRDIKGGPTVTLFRPSEMAKLGDVNWLHDGRLVYGIAEPHSQGNGIGNACNYWTMRLDFATGKHLEEPKRLTNWPNFCVFGGSVTNNDKRLAFVGSSGFYTSYVADLEAGGKGIRNVRRFTLEVDDAVHGWTADGKVLVAQNRNTWSLYKQSLDSDTPEPIVSSVAGGALQEGATTPDGKWYIGPIWPDGESPEHPTIPFPILRIPLAGGTPETILQLSRKGNVSCARPPSNRCVLAEQSQDRKQMIVSTLDPIKGRGSELVRFDFDQELGVLEFPICFISPDGARLAMARSPESPLEIRSLHGQLIRKIPSQSVGKLIWLNWSADQKGLFATREGQRGNELLYLDLEGKATFLRKCSDSGGDLNGGQCVALPSPDGRHVAILDRDQSNNMWMMENF